MNYLPLQEEDYCFISGDVTGQGQMDSAYEIERGKTIFLQRLCKGHSIHIVRHQDFQIACMFLNKMGLGRLQQMKKSLGN